MTHEFWDIKGQVVSFDGRVIEQFHHQNQDTDRKHIWHMKAVEMDSHRKGCRVTIHLKKFGAIVYIAPEEELPRVQAFVEAVNEALRELP